ncbi:transglutaminase-like domain-containing protein [Henriciella aquimarina]|uniref:transglutaminase-like domain-containing protein n=1 Tax=Henriciella aquimarina TaxID=545261 RepID=UPI000A0584E2|nr:transglutaminase family protein [Henriciella aquimarina]
MRVKIDAQLCYHLPEPADVLLAVEAIPMADQAIVNDRLEVSGPSEIRPVEGGDELGRRKWMEAAGDITIAYDATVDVERPPLQLAGLKVPPRRELPADVIPYLFPSRYCESDRLETFVTRRFGTQSGGDEVLLMADWIHTHFDYVPGVSNEATTATDSFLRTQGVCRDYSHVLISFARAAGIPARMVSVYAPGLEPPDFHAVVEVWLDGAWRLIDPAQLSSEQAMVRIAMGRDATDISFMTIFGTADLHSQTVSAVLMDTVQAG